jgi:AraC family transcriptional activator of pobA
MRCPCFISTAIRRTTRHSISFTSRRFPRNLFQILLIERGGGEMNYEAAKLPFAAPAAILVPAAVAHGFRFEPGSEGWVMSFTEDAAFALADRSGEALSRLRALAAHPIIPIGGESERMRLSALCAELFEEGSLAREGYRMAMRSLLALIAVTVARLAASRARTGNITLQPADATVAQLRTLVDEYFRREHQLGFYAEKLGMTVDRLNDHVKRATGVTAGHLIRQRLLTEAKRQLVFTTQPIQDIAEELSFSDPSHFARFFRKQAGTTPHEFRDRRG